MSATISLPAPATGRPVQRSLRIALPDTPGGIVAASEDAWMARSQARQEAHRRARARARVAAIDAMLDTLELRHLAGERTFDRLTRQRLRRLETEVGLPLPRKAVRARNTVRLHAALLDWQETVLDQVVPMRNAFDDRYDNDWNALTPVYPDASSF